VAVQHSHWEALALSGRAGHEASASEVIEKSGLQIDHSDSCIGELGESHEHFGALLQ
jgi:hypothetical protein